MSIHDTKTKLTTNKEEAKKFARFARCEVACVITEHEYPMLEFISLLLPDGSFVACTESQTIFIAPQ